MEASNAEMLAVLQRLEDRLERLEEKLSPVTGLVTQVPALSATVADILDDQANRLGDLELRLQAVMSLSERLTRPQTLSTLTQLVDVLETAPNLVATGADIFDEVMQEAAEDGLELTHLADHLKRHLIMILKLTASPELKALLESGMLDPKVLEILGGVAGSVVKNAEREPKGVGLFGAAFALGDSDVQRALGFLLAVASDFGKALRPEQRRLPAP